MQEQIRRWEKVLHEWQDEAKRKRREAKRSRKEQEELKRGRGEEEVADEAVESPAEEEPAVLQGNIMSSEENTL